MVEGNDRVNWKGGEKPREVAEQEASFKEMLITIVQYELKAYFKEKIWYWAARGAVALGDEILQRILLLTIMEQKELRGGQYEPPGRLAIALGNIALAEQIVRDLEKTLGEPYSDRAIVRMVTDLPYTRTPKRVMRVFEDRGDYGQVLNIASAIGDKKTIERLLTQMVSDGRLFPSTESIWLVKAALYNPLLGKQLLKELKMPEERKGWYMECTGLMAAVLGETGYAENAFQFLKERGRFYQLQAGKIATALGNISDAEEMVFTVYKPGEAFRALLEGDRRYSDSLGEIIGNVMKQDVSTAERIWGYMTRVEDQVFLPMVAIRVLEIIKNRVEW
jgi:hypothetical protein